MIDRIRIVENKNLTETKKMINRSWRFKKRRRLKKVSKFEPVRYITIPSPIYTMLGDIIYIHPVYAEKLRAELRATRL